jgi:putative Holliday junction resolvase
VAIVTIALDYGDARIGVALSRSGVLATPLTTVKNIGRKQVLDALQKIVDEHSVTRCVIGMPYMPSGDEGERTEKTRAFARSLARRLPALQIVFHDERYTTVDAEEIAGNRARDNKSTGVVDRIAAAVILREFLDAENAAREAASKTSGNREPEE